MLTNMMKERFQMREISRRNREISRRETEMLRAEAIASEMAEAVRLIGGDGSAKEQISRAARSARLPLTVVERLRWKKIKRVPADIADAVREAVERHTEECQNRAEHELYLARRQNAALAARLAEIDPAYARLVPSLDGGKGAAVGVRSYPRGGR